MKYLMSSFFLIALMSIVDAQDFNPKKCALIKNVHVNVEPSFSDDVISFISPEIHIVIAETSYTVNNQLIGLADYQGYHRLVKSFFYNAHNISSYLADSVNGERATQSNPNTDWNNLLSKHSSNEFLVHALSMCKVILDLYESNQVLAGQDENFVSGIVIHLNQGKPHESID